MEPCIRKMASYSFDFHTDFNGVEFQEIDVELACSCFARVWVKSSKDEGGCLKIQLDQLDSDEEALVRAKSLAEHIANVLSFGVSAGHWDSWTLDSWSRSADGKESVSQNLDLTERVDHVLALGTANREAIRTLLAQRQYSGLIYYNQFRSAVGLSDTLSRFMAIYGIVLGIVGDTQEKVDEFVLSIEPGVATNPPHRRRASGIPETVYTRLRNQIGHIRGVTLEATISEMTSNLGGLVAIARILIAQQLEVAPSIP